MVVLTSSLMLSQQVSLRRTANIINGDQAKLFTLAAENLGMLLLKRDLKDTPNDHMGEDWALSSLTGVDIPIPGFEHLPEQDQPSVNVRIQDLNSRFNLNNLINKKGQASTKDLEMFKRLLRTIGLSEVENIANSIVDWVDKDIDPTFPDGAEDNDYMGLEIPYRAANQLFISPTELYLVKGMTPQIYEKLFPFIAVLPTRTKINVNTATAELLTSISDSLTMKDAQEIVKERDEKFKQSGFAKLDQFIKLNVIGALVKKDKKLLALITEKFSVQSDYFLVTSMAQYGEGRMNLYSVVARDKKKVRVVVRGQGSY